MRNPDCPTKLELAICLLTDFSNNHSDINVTAIMADALYGESEFMDKASSIFGGVQTISQLRKNQNIFFKGKKKNLEEYFNSTNKGVQQVLIVSSNSNYDF